MWNCFRSLAVALLGLGVAWGAAPRPHIIFVLVDDMGWGDTSVGVSQGADGRPVIQTPTLETLAERGVQLRRHYTSAPVCAPARASLFSGVHQGHAEVVRNNHFDAALEDSHTLASVLKAAGYATALIGKWGIGGGREGGGTPETAAVWPTKRGFDYFFGYHNHMAGHRHYPKEEEAVDPDTGTNAVWDQEVNVTELLDGCYSTDLWVARAKRWIQDHVEKEGEQPFFLALMLTAPHARLAVPTMAYPPGGGVTGGLQWLGQPGRMINTASSNWDSYIDSWVQKQKGAWLSYAQKAYGNQAEAVVNAEQRHATMIRRVDAALGDLLALCRDLKIDRKTFIVLASDNGPHAESGAVSARPDHPALCQDPSFFKSYGCYDGIKRDVWEGGLRVPCFVYAPGWVKAGLSTDAPGQFHDWMATFAELAGVPTPMRCDGVSLMPILRGEPHRQKPGVVYSEYAFPGKMKEFRDFAGNKQDRLRGEQQIILFQNDQGKFLKAIRTGIQTGDEDFEIYDVDADPHEAHNLAEQYADRQQELKTAVLYQRRAYDYTRNPDAGKRNAPCNARRPYDGLLVPPNQVARPLPGVVMRHVQASCPWVPEFDLLPGSAQAEAGVVADPSAVELPAGSITEFRGYLRIPSSAAAWHVFLTLDAVPGSKAYVKMHQFQLVDADAQYRPGETADESAAANAVEALPEQTGKAGVPLEAGLHEVVMVVVQGEAAPGRLRLEWSQGEAPRAPIPAEAWFYQEKKQ